MLPNEIEIVELHGDTDLRWSFDGTPPYFLLDEGRYFSRETVDPFPGYGHDRDRVHKMLRDLSRVWPVGDELLVAITDRETIGRTNAWAKPGHGERDSQYRTRGMICLSGKRIPPHPAVTRYLMAHEYGHHVQYWLETAQGLDEGAVLEQYIEMRQPATTRYGGGWWHQNVGEVFACDFRMLVAGVETEYWPHAGVLPPTLLPGVQSWWRFTHRQWLEHIADIRLAAALDEALDEAAAA